MNYELSSRRGSNVRALTRSLSYSEAIGNNQRSSIEIPNIVNTDVYANEELKKQYRISQTYVEGREITFPSLNDDVFPPKTETTATDSQASTDFHYSSEEEHEPGLILTIDVETDTASPRTDTTRNFSDASTRPIVSSVENSDPMYDRIDTADSIYEEPTVPSSYTYSLPYTRRRKKGSRHRRMPGRPTRSRRVVHKNGEENVPVRSHIPAKSIKYMRDLVNTVLHFRFRKKLVPKINSKWRFLLLLMVVSHFVFWLVFAAIWLAVSKSYAEEIGDDQVHCVIGTSSFAGFLMMSVETQMTIGYGGRFPSEECPEAIFVMIIEIIAGTALSGGLSSLLFTKLIRPNRHVTSVGFSKKATVCLRDGQLCLQFRVWDLLNVHIINSTITAYMLKPIRTLEGERIHNYIHQLELKQARAFLLWPITVVHIIDKKSPLYDFSAQDMMDYRFEIVACLQGSSKNMGTVTQSRTSYLSKEINWGYRFKNVLGYCKKKEAYIIKTDDLNSVEQVETPLCSASRLKEFENDMKPSRNFHSRPHSPMTLSPMTASPTNLSLAPTNISSVHEEPLNACVQESPVMTRVSGTQRSLGWSFRRFYPENKKVNE